jgi:hypothetical protein
VSSEITKAVENREIQGVGSLAKNKGRQSGAWRLACTKTEKEADGLIQHEIGQELMLRSMLLLSPLLTLKATSTRDSFRIICGWLLFVR